jgi:hypothetical protein
MVCGMVQYGALITKYFLGRKVDEKSKKPRCCGHVAGAGV